MAAPLMSLLSPGTIKHVVPWRDRSEFLSVYNDLYSENPEQQERALKVIQVWKSRAWNKMSVAIESSAALTQACLEHTLSEKAGTVLDREHFLRNQYSLALIRFVNHITEKGQTKATAQPVHLIAREFGIPEWIVRLRHDATHSSIPCLNSLCSGAHWALNYLQQNFWQLQTKENESDEVEQISKLPKMSDIRRAFYDFQKSRFKEVNADSREKEKDTGEHETLKVLHRYLNQNRLRFVNCLLEDGILISTLEQLKALGVSTEDLIERSPPTVPLEMVEFWRPLLRKLNNADALPFMLNIAILSVSSGEGLRNYQLVAWTSFLLSQCLGLTRKGKRRRTKRQKKENIFKNLVPLPKQNLLNACLHNINKLTAHLLHYLADKESLGSEHYTKIMKLLNLNTQPGDTASSDGSDSDTVYTVEDIKMAKLNQSAQISSYTVNEIQTSLDDADIPWSLCTDIVDWSTVPLGVIPSFHDDDEDDEEEGDTNSDMEIGADDADKNSSDLNISHSSGEEEDDDSYVGVEGSSKKRQTESKEDSDSSWSSKRSKLLLEDELI